MTASRGTMAEYRKRPLFGYECRGYKTPCWVWKKSKLTPNGYAKMWAYVGGIYAKVFAHRYYYELVNGSIPHKKTLDHLCRQRDCIRPDHLEPVSQTVNVQRGAATKLSNKEVREIADLRNYGFSGPEIAAWYGITRVTVYIAVRFRAKGLPSP